VKSFFIYGNRPSSRRRSLRRVEPSHRVSLRSGRLEAWETAPLIVLTAGKPLDPDPILTKEQVDKLKNLWIYDLQLQEAHLSTRGKQIIVPDSTHMIPIDRPDAVASAIHEVWSATAQ
jgi:pimeloyl-ACP methyl ester carboxylesterase